MNTKRYTIETAIKEGLGYCCLHAFFSIFSSCHDTDMIATRLGVTDRAVRYYKQKFKDGKFQCQNCPNCMKDKLKVPK